MEFQVEKNEHLRHVLLFEFNRGINEYGKSPNAVEIAKKFVKFMEKVLQTKEQLKNGPHSQTT